MRYWFARSGDAKYPIAMVPISWHGKVLMAFCIAALLAAWAGSAILGSFYDVPFINRLPIFAAGFLPFFIYLLLAFVLKGDRNHTARDYKVGLVDPDTGAEN